MPAHRLQREEQLRATLQGGPVRQGRGKGLECLALFLRSGAEQDDRTPFPTSLLAVFP